MARSKSSHRWLREHFSDPYVKRTQAEGYRSRASYKLLEIQRKDRLFKPGMTVIDLGAAPGGWSQVAVDLVAVDRADNPGRVIATDILPMDALAGVEFLQGDFTEQAVLDDLLARLGEAGADLVISDMAPNMSGIKAVDQPKAMYLVELAVELVKQTLVQGGGFVTKAFQGEGFDEVHRDLKSHFGKVVSRKPDASRPRSPEIYLVATDFKGNSV